MRGGALTHQAVGKAFPVPAAPIAHFRVKGELCLCPRKSSRENRCHGSQKAVRKPKNSDPNLSLPRAPPRQQPELLILRKTYQKQAKSLNNCVPTARVEKHTRHIAGWNPTPPIFSHKSMVGPSPVHLCAGGGKVSPVLQGCAIQVFHLHPKCNTKTGKRDNLGLVVLKNPERTNKNKSSCRVERVRAAIKPD